MASNQVRKTKYDLRCHPYYFQEILEGKQSFICRQNDQNYQVGDEITLREYLPDTKFFTGRVWHGFVTFTLKDFEGLKEGWIILSLRIN